jgi:hypothetical protein
LGISVARKADAVSIRVVGAGSVRFVSEARAALLDALGDRLDASVELAEATSVDAAFVQLVASATSSFAAASQSLRVDDPSGLLGAAFSQR